LLPAGRFGLSFPALAVAENQPTRLDRRKNRMIYPSTLAEVCEAVAAFIARCNEPVTAGEFDRLALDLFAFQFDQNEAYANFCRIEKRIPGTVTRWEAIPAVPTRAFKSFDLTVLSEATRTNVFHSSGTTQFNRSRHHHNAATLSIYETSLWSWFKEHMVDETEGKLLFLFPKPNETKESSLSHMMGTVAKHLVKREHRFVTDAQWRIDGQATVDFLHHATAQNEPVTLLGTAFSFVHLLDFMTDEQVELRLPAGSAAMETGGYKGRSREVSKPELHYAVANRLGILTERILCEYGMCELSSQAYDGKLGQTNPAPRLFHFPPWARARVVSPETLDEIEIGQAGLLEVTDLANVGSAICILTEDLAKRHKDGFELLRRTKLSESRGCSLMNLNHA